MVLRAAAMLNSIYEGTEATAVMGASSQTVKGHDHGDYGGRAVARNVVVAAGNGANILFRCPIASAASWIKGDGEGAGNPHQCGHHDVFRVRLAWPRLLWIPPSSAPCI